MAKSLTTDSIVKSIFRRGMIPANQSTFTNADIIEIMNEELQIQLLPVVMKVHQEYYTITEDISVVADQSRYEIPYRAIGNKLRDIHYKDSTGNLSEMTRLAPELRSETNYNSYNSFNQFYLENNEFVLLGDISDTSGSFAASYWLRPNDLVTDSRGGVITAIDTTTGVITMSNYPSHFSDLTTMDFVAHKSPNIILDFDLQPTATDLTLKTITFDPDDLPSKLQVGDYLMKAEESIVPQMPSEMIVLLMQRVAIKCLEALGDTEAMNSAKSDLQQMEYNVNSLIDNRVEGAPIKVNNRNSLLYNSSGRRRRF